MGERGETRGLLDEILIHLAPVRGGDGIRLFGSPAAERVELEKLSVADAGQLTDLRFRVSNRVMTRGGDPGWTT